MPDAHDLQIPSDGVEIRLPKHSHSRSEPIQLSERIVFAERIHFGGENRSKPGPQRAPGGPWIFIRPRALFQKIGENLRPPHDLKPYLSDLPFVPPQKTSHSPQLVQVKTLRPGDGRSFANLAERFDGERHLGDSKHLCVCLRGWFVGYTLSLYCII